MNVVMTTGVLTFSGTHPFRRQHAGVRGSRALLLISQEICPRCEGPLYPPDREEHAILIRKGDPHPIWRPAGSRVTACRCIPICDICGFAESISTPARELLMKGLTFEDDETMDPGERKAFLDGLEYVSWTGSTQPRNWPVDRDRMILGVAVLRMSGILEEHLAEDIPWEDLKFREHPGGWADPDN